jgi:GntR family transcriptional regulator, transcriptional repressor for pyruvate dehydrogenase complex
VKKDDAVATDDATSTFSRLKLAPRSAQVREQLEDAILRGDFRPGQRLPSERELTELFGVSRVSVREAIRSLEAVGLVEVRHGSGTTVADRSKNTTRDLSRWMKTNRVAVLELLMVRGALDALAGEEAALRHDELAIGRIRTAHEEFVQAAENGNLDRQAAFDVRFHLAIAQASESELLHNLLSELHQHLAESRLAFFAPHSRPRASAKEHQAILTAIERRDAAAVRRATRRHIASVRRLIDPV